MSVIVREDLNEWITLYTQRGDGGLDIDDIKRISRQIDYEMNGEEWDYDMDDDCKLLIVYKGY
jgi:hypothetical protein